MAYVFFQVAAEARARPQCHAHPARHCKVRSRTKLYKTNCFFSSSGIVLSSIAALICTKSLHYWARLRRPHRISFSSVLAKSEQWLHIFYTSRWSCNGLFSLLCSRELEETWEKLYRGLLERRLLRPIASKRLETPELFLANVALANPLLLPWRRNIFEPALG